MPVVGPPSVAVAPPVVSAPQAGPIGDLVERIQIHRQLKIALKNGNLTPTQKDAAAKLLNHPLAYEAAVDSVHKDLLAKMRASGAVGKLGNGTLLKILLDNLPQIMAAVMQILHAFGIG